MLILVGVTVTVAINGGLFEKSKDFANTTLEKTKENLDELKGSICPMKKSSEEKVELKNKEEE